MADFEIHLLDPGAIEYGDCVLCLVDGKSILIDAGKKASAKETRDTVLGRDIVHPAIQEQIESVLGSTTLDLLIITHCHSDHVGDLPRLILDEVIACEYALIADPQLGFGIVGGDAGPLPPVDRLSPAEKLWLALREEPFHSSDDAAVRQFIEDSAAEYQIYANLVEFLAKRLGPRCVRYRGPAEQDSAGLTALLTNFAGTGLTIFGPSLAQLGNCASFLVGRSEDVADLQGELQGRVDLVAAYRQQLAVAGSAAAADAGATSPVAEDVEDTPENGNAVNNQSIVFAIGQGPTRALLTGDMQFVRPQLSNAVVTAEMQSLRDRISNDVAKNGKFGFLKLSHHGATNGSDAALLQEWCSGLYGISTGSASTKHPTAPTLAALKALWAEFKEVEWGRTDLNGRITYKVANDRGRLLKERGRWNDLTPPSQRVGDAGPSETASAGASPPVAVPPAPPRSEITRAVRSPDGNVEVTIRLPLGKGRVRVTIDTDPEASPPLN